MIIVRSYLSIIDILLIKYAVIMDNQVITWDNTIQKINNTGNKGTLSTIHALKYKQII